MDQVAVRLDGSGQWTYLGGKADAKKPLEVVVRSFDAEIEFTSGSTADAPDGDPVRVPAGEGRRLEGLHFFVRSSSSCRASYRGL